MSTKQISFSIIIPLKSLNDYVRETVDYVLALEYSNWDLYILTNDNELNPWVDARIQVVATGRLSPARKRDIGASLSSADILVFLDDDSYPERDLLRVAEQEFKNPAIYAIGGPAITPANSTFLQRVSGATFLSRYSGGFPERYLSIGKKRTYFDWPSVNLMVRRSIFLELGGFDSDFWPGEDTAFCLKLLEKYGAGIVYVPDLVVWHHRREGFFRHLKQIGSYGKHRGYFARLQPKTSRQLKFFVPSMFLIFSIFSLSTLFFDFAFGKFVVVVWVAYGAVVTRALVDINKVEGLRVALVSILYIFSTHLWYGWCFIIGICTPRLVSKLR